MGDKVLKEIIDRGAFLSHLDKDILAKDALLQETTSCLEKLEVSKIDIKSLSVYPEQVALIPLAKNIYMNGRIIHTGEYYVNHVAYPDSYTVLQSLDQTLNSLDEKIKQQKKVLETIESAKKQLEERKKILIGDAEEAGTEDVSDMPKEIKSDKGVALKVGEFYEILEFED